MEKIVEFLQWFSAQNSRAIAIIFGSCILLGQTAIIVYQDRKSEKNAEIVRYNERRRDSIDVVNFNRYNNDIIILRSENKELLEKINECQSEKIQIIEKHTETFKNLYEKKEMNKIERNY